VLHFFASIDGGVGEKPIKMFKIWHGLIQDIDHRRA
jgi:hypothetical protein